MTIAAPKKFELFVPGPKGLPRFVQLSITALSYDAEEDYSKYVNIK